MHKSSRKQDTNIPATRCERKKYCVFFNSFYLQAKCQTSHCLAGMSLNLFLHIALSQGGVFTDVNSDQVLYWDIYFKQIVEAHVINILFLSDSLLALKLLAVCPSFIPPWIIHIKVHAILRCPIPSSY